MFFLIELGVALKATAKILARRQFWAALAKATMSPPLLLVLAGLAVVYATVDVPRVLLIGHEVPLAALACAWLLLPPVLMHAWCPPIARAVNAVMQLGLPERQQYKLWLFIFFWLCLVVVQAIASWVALMFSSDVALWGILVPAVLLSGVYLQRATLCIHAGLKTSRALFRATFVRRILVWVPLTGAALFCSSMAGVALKGSLLGSHEVSAALRVIDLLLIVFHLPVVAALLTLWAALVLPALGQLQGARTARPAFVLPGRKVALCAVLLIVVVAGYIARLRLLDAYFALSDKEYAAERRNTGRLDFYKRMPFVVCQAAGKDQVDRIESLYKFGYRMSEEDLTAALDCSVANNRIEATKYLIGRGAAVDGLTYIQRSRPFRNAVEKGHVEVARLLLSLGADPNTSKYWRQSGEPSLLNLAAQNRDVAMLHLLREAGTKPFAEGPQPVFKFAEGPRSRREGVATDWPAVISAMEEAGLSINDIDGDGGNLLHWAAGHGEFGLIAILLKRGIDPLQPDKEGELPFLRLADWYRQAKVEPGPELELSLALLSKGVADINAPVHGHLASIAAVKPRVRQVFAGRLDYSTRPQASLNADGK